MTEDIRPSELSKEQSLVIVQKKKLNKQIYGDETCRHQALLVIARSHWEGEVTKCIGTQKNFEMNEIKMVMEDAWLDTLVQVYRIM